MVPPGGLTHAGGLRMNLHGPHRSFGKRGPWLFS